MTTSARTREGRKMTRNSFRSNQDDEVVEVVDVGSLGKLVVAAAVVDELRRELVSFATSSTVVVVVVVIAFDVVKVVVRVSNT